MELVFTSATGKLQASIICTTLCSYRRMSWVIAMTKEQHSVVDYIIIIGWRWTTSATAKKDYATSHTDSSNSLVDGHRYSNSSSPRRCCWVEYTLNVRYNRGYSNGASEKAKKKQHRSKQKDHGAKKANTPVPVWPLDDWAELQERERLATKLGTTKKGSHGTTLLGSAAPAAPVILLVGAHIWIQQQAAISPRT